MNFLWEFNSMKSLKKCYAKNPNKISRTPCEVSKTPGEVPRTLNKIPEIPDKVSGTPGDDQFHSLNIGF